MTQKLRGREGEERQIMRMLHTVAADASAVLHVEGGWGSGRTRLLREAADAAGRLGFTVVDGDWDPGAEPAALSRKSTSRQPVLVVLDDLQHADPAFARRLLTLPWRLRDRPIAWLLSRRRGAGGPSVDQLFACTFPSGGRIDLRPLPPQAVRLVMADCTYGAVTGLPSLLRAAGGNPLLTVELARSMRGMGAEGAVNHPPVRVQACVRSGLAELGPGCRQLLQVGAVLGARFALSDVATMLHRPAADLLAPLDEALAADVLSSEGDRLVFAQELFWRCVLVSLPHPARTALRREAAAKQVDTTAELLAETSVPRQVVGARQAGARQSEARQSEARQSEARQSEARQSEARDQQRSEVGDHESRDAARRGIRLAEPVRPAPGWATLNDIERKIAELVSQGLTNQQIARHVFRSPHTINYHLRQIFRKLGIHSRVELARLTLHYSPDGDADDADDTDDAIDAAG